MNINVKRAFKNTATRILIALVACFLLITCADPTPEEEGPIDGGGLITVTIGDSKDRKAVSWANGLDTNKLEHTIIFSGGPGTAPSPRTIPPGGGSANFWVLPGECTIKVEGKIPSGEVVAVGTLTKQISQGNNGAITVEMQEPNPPFPSYTVSFNSNGGNAVASQTVKKYCKAERPKPDPTHGDKYFINWYSDGATTRQYNFDDPVYREHGRIRQVGFFPSRYRNVQ